MRRQIMRAKIGFDFHNFAYKFATIHSMHQIFAE
jgi:hypothetical protein